MVEKEGKIFSLLPISKFSRHQMGLYLLKIIIFLKWGKLGLGVIVLQMRVVVL